jgi:TIR domain
MRVRRRGVPHRVSEREATRSEPVRGGPDIGARAGERGDIVDCSVFSRPSAAAGDTVFVQVFAHLVEQAEEVGAIAEEFDADAERRAVKTLETVVPRESRLTFELRISRLSVIEPVESLVWRGTTESVQFEVEVPEETRPGDVVGTVTVALDSVPIGHVKFKLTVVTQDAKPGVHNEPVGDDAKRYTSVFVSYSAKDRRKVLERVQLLKALGIHYFQDLLELDAGDRWERELYLRIDECDLFLLFWSSDAKASTWVRKEAQYAVDRKAGDDFAAPEIRPVIIEGPPIPPPWPELAHLHFSDSLVYLLAGLD